MSSWLTGPHMVQQTRPGFPAEVHTLQRGRGGGPLGLSHERIPMSLVDFNHPKVGGGSGGQRRFLLRKGNIRAQKRPLGPLF